MAQSELSVLIKGKDELTPEFNRIESRLIRFVGAVTSALATIKIASFPIASAGDFERELANVKKTTGFTKTEIDQLGEGILQLSLRSDQSAVGLAKIASAAGQQGLGGEGVKGILAFTDSVARMASVLDITVEQASSDIGKILSIFQLPITDSEKVVSAFNKVSNNAPAKGRELLDIVKRIGDAAEVAGQKAGSLNNAIALAATGLELGVNPEVIGTSFVKILAQFQTKAAQFAEIMKMSTKEWSDLVAKDGLKALQMFNNVLRAQDRVSQAQTIAALAGQGRVFGLDTKLTRDTLDASLSKNLGNAQSGFDSGLSAIKEQRTVLATLNSQLIILKNSFFKLAAEGGSPLLRTLTDQVSTLSAALQEPKVQAFVQAAVKSFGDLITMVFSVGSAVGGMNVNWENFLKVAKLLLEVKLVQIFAGLLAQIPGVTAGLNLITRGASAAALASLESALAQRTAALEATVAAGTATQATLKQLAANKLLTEQIVAQRAATELNAAKTQLAAEQNIATIASLKRAYADYGLTKKAAEQATTTSGFRQADLTAANRAQVDALNRRQVANAALTTANNAVTAGQGVVAARQADLAAVTARGQADVLVAQNVGQANIQASNQRHNAVMLQLNRQYSGTLTAQRQANYDVALRQENAFYTRQQAALAAADRIRIRDAQATANAMTAIASQRLGAATGTLGGLQATQATANAGAAAAGAAVAGSIILSRQAQNAADIARIAAERAAEAAKNASTSFFSFGRLVGLLGTGLTFLLTKILPVFFGLTILYSILDSFKLLDGLPKFFERLADAIGLSSESARVEAQRQKDATEALRKKEEAVQELVDAYKQLLDASGKINPVDLSNQLAALNAATDAKNRLKLIKDISGQGAASEISRDRVSSDLSNLPESKAQAQANLDALLKEKAALEKELKAQQENAKLLKNVIVDTPGGQIAADSGAVKAIERITFELSKLDDKLKVALKNKDALLGPLSGAGFANLSKNVNQNATEQENQISRLFTPQSAALFTNPEVGVLAQRRAIDELEALETKKKEIQLDVTTIKNEEDRKKKLELLSIPILAATEKLELMRKKFTDLSETMLKVKGVSDNVFVGLSIKFLDDILKSTTKEAENFDRGLAAIRVRNALAAENPNAPRALPLLGDKTGQTLPAPPSTGDQPGLSDKKAESEARKLAKAQFEFDKQKAIAEMNRKKELNDELLAEDQRKYNRGLLDLQTFYDNKREVDEQNVRDEIAKIDKEIEGKKAEQASPAFAPSDRKKFDADLKALEGQSVVLNLKLKEIPNAARETLSLAVKSFNEGVLSEKLDVIKGLGLGDFDEQLKTQFDLLNSQLKFRLDALRTEMNRQGTTAGITDSLIKNIGLNGLLKNFDDVLQSIANKAQITAAAVQNAFNRIEFGRQTGRLTDREAERATNNTNRIAANGVDQQIQDIVAQKERTLGLERAKVATGELTQAQADANIKTIEGSKSFKEQENVLDGLRQQYIRLRTAIDEVATTINLSLTDSLARALENFTNRTDKNLRQMIRTFTTSLTSAINGVVIKDFSQSFVKDVLGSSGTGGLGGFFSKLFNPDGVGGNTKEVNLAQLGTQARPMITKDWKENPDPLGDPNLFPKDAKSTPAVDPGSFMDNFSKVLSGKMAVSDAVLAGVHGVSGWAKGMFGKSPVPETKPSDVNKAATDASKAAADVLNKATPEQKKKLLADAEAQFALQPKDSPTFGKTLNFKDAEKKAAAAEAARAAADKAENERTAAARAVYAKQIADKELADKAASDKLLSEAAARAAAAQQKAAADAEAKRAADAALIFKKTSDALPELPIAKQAPLAGLTEAAPIHVELTATSKEAIKPDSAVSATTNAITPPAQDRRAEEQALLKATRQAQEERVAATKAAQDAADAEQERIRKGGAVSDKALGGINAPISGTAQTGAVDLSVLGKNAIAVPIGDAKRGSSAADPVFVEPIDNGGLPKNRLFSPPIGPTPDGGNLNNPSGPAQDGTNIADTTNAALADLKKQADEGVTTAAISSTQILTTAASIFGGGDPIQNILGMGFKAVKKEMFDGISSLTGGPKGEGLGITKVFESIKGGLGDVFSGLGDTISSMAGGVTDTLGSVFSGLASVISSAFSDTGGGGGGGFASLVASFFHTGGVVGGAGAGRTGSFSPMVFAGAMRYHTGGIAGLQPNEVPSILKKGEEVLTANDPRHRNNGGAAGGNVAVHMTINTPDANSFRRSQDQLTAQAGAAANRSLRRNL